jgi:serine/threonine protein kinase
MIPDCYEVLEHLGEGTYGTVCKVRDRNDGFILALKRMSCVEPEGGIAAATIREVMLLRIFSHPNLVGIRRIHMNVPNVAIALEYCEYDLKKYVKSLPGEKIPLPDVKRFMHHLFCGLAYLHSEHNVVHRDLKLQNLLISCDPVYGHILKLADFGLARVEGFPVKKYIHDAVTLWYRSPDIILGNVLYGFTADMWSAGIIMAQMMTGELLFKGRDEAGQLRAMFQFLGRPCMTNSFPSMNRYRKFETMVASNKLDIPCPPNEYLQRQEWYFGTTRFVDDPQAQDLLLKLLRYEPCERLSAVEALRHPYFAGVDVYPGSMPSNIFSFGTPGGADRESGDETRIISILCDAGMDSIGGGGGTEVNFSGSKFYSTSAELAEGLWQEAALLARRSENSSSSFEDSTRRSDDNEY